MCILCLTRDKKLGKRTSKKFLDLYIYEITLLSVFIAVHLKLLLPYRIICFKRNLCGDVYGRHAKFCPEFESRLTVQYIRFIWKAHIYRNFVVGVILDAIVVEPARIKLAINYRHQIITLGFNCAHKITSRTLLPRAIFPYVKMFFRGRNSCPMTLSMHDVCICNIVSKVRSHWPHWNSSKGNLKDAARKIYRYPWNVSAINNFCYVTSKNIS